MSPERLAGVSAFGTLGVAAIVFVIVMLILYARSARDPE